METKWLRYFLDFCEKYGFDPDDPQSLPYFIDNLINGISQSNAGQPTIFLSGLQDKKPHKL